MARAWPRVGDSRRTDAADIADFVPARKRREAVGRHFARYSHGCTAADRLAA